ncbi:MAG: hypothetical protein F6K28_08800 [Microcoleus sp. SIO2G3]|nr:hypothetical protein [Microcoleus sp. SIO2G3]
MPESYPESTSTRYRLHSTSRWIAEKFYGDRTCWQTIYDANQDVIVLIPGVELFIPLDLCSELQREWQIIVV